MEEKEVNVSERVEPFQTKEILVEFPTNLGIGEYWGEIEVYKDEELVKKDKQVFNILEKTAATGLESKEERGKEEKRRGFPELYIGIGLVVLAGLIFLVWKKREILIARKKEK